METPHESDRSINANYKPYADPSADFARKMRLKLNEQNDSLLEDWMLSSYLESNIPPAIKKAVKEEIDELMKEVKKQFKNELRDAMINELSRQVDTPEGRKKLFEKMFDTDYYYD